SCGVLLSLLASTLLGSAEQRSLGLEAADAAATRTAALTGAVHDGLGLVASARVLFEVSDGVTRAGFGQLTRALGSNISGLRAFFFLRRVEASERTTFEELREHDLEGFVIRDVLPTGASRPARDRSVYFPIDFAEPSNDLAGLDPGGDPRCRAALDEAAGFNRQAAAVGARRLGDSAGSPLVVPPVYGSINVPAEVAARRRALRGFVGILAGVGPLVEGSLAPGSASGAVDMFIFDDRDSLLYSRRETRLPLPD